MNWIAAFWAGVAAAVISSAVELLLWATLPEALPGVLWRDARLTAAIVLGPAVLAPPAGFDATVVLVATLIHFALSIVYAAALAAIIARLNPAWSMISGALFGLTLYAINLYGFTMVFPWFAVARDGITLAAHVAFGLSASAAYYLLGNGRTKGKS